MTELDQALDDIHRIRRQVADQTEFRGYGPATLASTAAMAVFAAFVQRWLDPANMSRHYLGIWIATALIAGSVSALQIRTRTQREHAGISDVMITMAVQQFIPAVVAGLLLTLVLVLTSPNLLWLLPGLWQITFSLGIASSCRFLPKAMLAPAVWYLTTGLTAVAMGSDRALSPWVMGAPFAVGQLLIAAVIYLHNGKEHDNA